MGGGYFVMVNIDMFGNMVLFVIGLDYFVCSVCLLYVFVLFGDLVGMFGVFEVLYLLG